MRNVFEFLSTLFRRWSGSPNEGFELLEIKFPPTVDGTPLLITLRENHLQCEQALIWFNSASQAIAPTSRVHQMLLSCSTATAGATMRRLAPEALEKVYLQTQDTPSPDALAAFLRATAECVGKDRLYQIKISDYALHSGPTRSPLVDQHLTFGPLLSGKMWSLRTLELELTDVLAFTDAFVERLAGACPRVTHLRLCGPPFENRIGMDREPGMTLEALRILAERCPELCELQIEVDATHVEEPEEEVSRKRRELIELGVGMSPVSQPEKVAAYITRVFPDLLQLSWYEGRWFEDGLDSGHVMGWESVRDNMGLYSFPTR